MKIKIEVDRDEVWLYFIGINVAISIESIARKSGPIVAKELRKWARQARQEHQMKNNCWKCARCGTFLDSSQIEPYGNDYIHIIPCQVGIDDCEPQPCGPVKPCIPIEEKQNES